MAVGPDFVSKKCPDFVLEQGYAESHILGGIEVVGKGIVHDEGQD